MTSNQETMVWLLNEERARQLDDIEREHLARDGAETSAADQLTASSGRVVGLRRAIGGRLIRLGANLAQISAAERSGLVR
jgi:hypothetical protein